jgi:hypothetical protein
LKKVFLLEGTLVKFVEKSWKKIIKVHSKATKKHKVFNLG